MQISVNITTIFVHIIHIICPRLLSKLFHKTRQIISPISTYYIPVRRLYWDFINDKLVNPRYTNFKF
jgi:hypothetical protein